jgi:short-subunit dehydrogenase
MKERGSGKILYTSSIASKMPSPFEAVYGASKAFLTSFAESIRNELKDTGVTVTVLMPGATNTNFFHRAHMDNTKAGAEMKYDNDPEEVARQGFEALMEGKESVFAESFMTKLQGYALKILPEKAKAQFHRKWSEPGTAQQ